MARFHRLLGRKVEVVYRAGEILLRASGTFVADSGRSIFLEQSMLQHGQTKHFRWEIPYQFIVRIEEIIEEMPAGAAGETVPAAESPAQSSARAAVVGVPAFLPLSDKPKTA